jgi:glycosyltransferase involved in cell wall biosynthesis
MKITFVLTTAGMSGGTRVIATQAQELMARGHEVAAFSTPPPPPGLRRTVSSLIHGRGWPTIWKAGESFFDGSGIPHTRTARFRRIDEHDLPDADVVVATWWETAEWVWRLPPSKGAKVFFIQHYEVWGGQEERVDDAWRLPLRKIVISKWLEDLAREKFGDDTVWRVPNSVDMKLFNAPPRGRQKQPTIGLLYNNLWIKGCDVSIKALEIVRRKFPDLRIVSFGEKQIDPEMPLPEGSNYVVHPQQQNIKEVYNQCDVWLCGSRTEGFHLPPLEAMACRCPVVSTRVGGPLDTIDEGKNGHVVDVEDAAGLADRVIRMLSLSDFQWREMSDAAYATACRYTWQDAAALMEKALQAAVGKSTTPRPPAAASSRA